MEAKKLSKEAVALIKQFDLSLDSDDGDIFFNHQFKIITRQGIDKIIAKADIKIIDLDVIFCDPYEIQLKGTYAIGSKSITTTASASVDRKEIVKLSKSKTTNVEDRLETISKEEVEIVILKRGSVKQDPAYLPEMAEKRCNSRGVLKLTGFYDHGFYGQDESDDFNDAVRGSKRKPKNSDKGVAVSSKSI